MNHELMIAFFMSHEKAPIVITDHDNSVIWMNDAFIKAFPTMKNENLKYLNQSFEFYPDESSIIHNSYIKTQEFKCIDISMKSKSMLSGVLISDGIETLYCFESDIITEQEIVEKISVVNMELASVSRELSRKNREVEDANNRANDLLRTDFLTGCGNRRYFIERLEEFCSRYTRNNEHTFCVVFADLNKFKHINDTFGHDVGDVALKMFSDSMLKVIRKEDVFARIGGDEFAMIIECDSTKACEHFIDKLRMATTTIKLPEINHPISSSFGYVFSKESVDSTTLMKEADERLYADKNRIIS